MRSFLPFAVALGMLMPALASSQRQGDVDAIDRKSTRLNSSHGYISYAVFCLKKKKKDIHPGGVGGSGVLMSAWTPWSRDYSPCAGSEQLQHRFYEYKG